MAKRARGSSTTRPGQRRPLQRSATRSAAAARPAAPVAPPPATLTDEEEARAAELEAQIVAQEREAETAKRRSRDRATEEVAPRATSNLAASHVNEYAYVARDVRRIAMVGGSLVVFLLSLWVISRVTGLGPF
jgi:hypothetical protein